VTVSFFFDEWVGLPLTEGSGMGDCSGDNSGLLTGTQCNRIIESDIDKTKAAWGV